MNTNEQVANSSPVWSTRKLLLVLSVPYLVLLASQLPLFVVYVRNLLIRQPHYRFVPFLAIVIVWLMWDRWPRGQEKPVTKSLIGSFCVLVGAIAGIAATVFMNPWLAAFAMCCFLTGWLSRVRDREADRSLFQVGLLAFLGLQLPLGLDVRLIQYLQRFSAFCASKILELTGQMHDMPGTVLIFPGKKEYFVEEACSGVQSLFTLLFCAGAYAVWRRYSLPRLGVLLFVAAGWAVLMNSLRILAIPMADIHYGIDLVSGWRHEVLGYVALTMAVLLLLSSDRLLSIVLTPIALDEDAVLSAERAAKRNRFYRWMTSDDGWSSGSLSSKPWMSVRYIGVSLIAVLLGGLGVLQAKDVGNLLGNTRRTASFFGDVEIVRLNEQDLPVSVGPWTCQKFESEDRTRSSELGEHSDTWQYLSKRYVSAVSLDQPFPGWHELSVCYTNQGWHVKKRRRVDVEMSEGGESWPYVEIEMQNDLGEFGFLLFSFFDTDGKPFDAPDDWGTFNSLAYRIQNRLSFRIREQLFQSETYQAQVFVKSTRPLTDEELMEIRDNYLVLRDQLRQRLLERKAAEQLTRTSSAERPLLVSNATESHR